MKQERKEEKTGPLVPFPTVVIIGAGASAAALVIQLAPYNVDITVIGRTPLRFNDQRVFSSSSFSFSSASNSNNRKSFNNEKRVPVSTTWWRGAAYSTQVPWHLLNIPKKGMSIIPDKPLDFFEWIIMEQQKKEKEVDDVNDEQQQQEQKQQRTPFAKWACENDHGHVPRKMFGDYLADRVAQATADSGGDINLIRGEVLGIERGGHKVTYRRILGDDDDDDDGVYKSTTSSFSSTAAAATTPTTVCPDAIILAFGNLRPTILPVLRPLLLPSSSSPHPPPRQFITDPWKFPKLAGASSSSSSNSDDDGAAPVVVGIVGSRLTAVDFVLSLTHGGTKTHHFVGNNNNKKRLKIIMFSRTGQLPFENLSETLRPPLPNRDRIFAGLLLDGDPSSHSHNHLLDAVAARLRNECKKKVHAPHDIVDALRPDTNAIWQRLSSEERRRFLHTHMRDEFETRRHRVARGQLALIRGLAEQGVVEHCVGRISAARFVMIEEGGRRGNETTPTRKKRMIELAIDPSSSSSSSSQKSTVRRVDYLVNCTGPELDFSTTSDPFVQNLVASQIIVPEPNGVAMLVDPKSGRVVKNKQQQQERGESSASQFCCWSNIFAVGPPRKGSEWESIAIFDIRRQAVQVANSVATSLCLHRDAPEERRVDWFGGGVTKNRRKRCDDDGNNNLLRAKL